MSEKEEKVTAAVEEEPEIAEENKKEKIEKPQKKGKEEIIEERVYTIPLTHAWIAPVKKRSPRAMKVLKEFLKRHMKIDNFVISKEVNERLWSKGIEGAPRKVRVRTVKDKDGIVTVYLAKGG